MFLFEHLGGFEPPIAQTKGPVERKNIVPRSIRSVDLRAVVRGVLPREVAQAVEVPTILEATELGRVMQARSCLVDDPVNVCP